MLSDFLGESIIPAIIPDLNHAVFDSYGKSCGRLVSRCSQGFPGPDRKARAVARTDNLVMFDATTGQLAAVVGADIFDCIKILAQFEHRDADAIHFNMHRYPD